MGATTLEKDDAGQGDPTVARLHLAGLGPLGGASWPSLPALGLRASPCDPSCTSGTVTLPGAPQPPPSFWGCYVARSVDPGPHGPHVNPDAPLRTESLPCVWLPPP